MGYGLRFNGTNNQLIFDTDFNSGNTITLNPYSFDSQGALTPGTSTITSSSTLTMNIDDLLFVRVNSGTLRGNMTYNTNYTQKSFVPSQDTGYFIARKSSSVTNITSLGNYGLEIYGPPDSQGNQEVTFSTRRADSSVNVQYIFDHQELTHEDKVWENSIEGIYVSVGHMYYQFGGGTWGCYDFSSSNLITFDSELNLGLFGLAKFPNAGNILIASVRG